MKKIAAWLSDTNGWVAIPGILAFFVIVYGSVIFEWNNIYSHAVHKASVIWHLIGWLLSIVMVALFIRATTMDNAQTGDIVVIGVALVLSIFAFAGFSI